MRQPFRRASLYVTLLLITEAVIGFLFLVISAYYHVLLTSYLDEIETRLVLGYVFGLYMYGAQLVVTFLVSISMWRRLWRRRCTPNVHLILAVWLFYSCVIIASGFGCVWNLYRGVDVLESAAETSLIRGIDLYYSFPEWKLLWDGLQWHKECCGVHDYKDWMNADWMPRQEDNCSLTILAPYACCKRSCESCYTNYSPGGGISEGRPIPALTVDSINTNGCLPVFNGAVTNFVYILLALWALSLKFLIMLCCISKYILNRQNQGDGCDNVGLSDDDGHPLVVVKYPCNVRCVTIGEDDLGSDIAPNYCNCNEVDEDHCEEY
ncbi:uncharacterized protein Dana_GF15335 [Drosophila ananassae]|uniref:Tetraspanin n=1 Tax=Drosophila ananassae TaxID=7217 RepID=B3MJQ9_DROAN|nr:uncharacterized protein LOC6498148 [Drosophila ananassae]EDV31398.1 uncharacterized protein Dana_GF15335 [Drosophila ananassae]